MTLDELIVRIRVAADGTDGELDGVLADLKRFVSDAEKSTKSSADAQATAWAGLADAAGIAFRGIVGAIQTGIDASNQYKSAVMGLESVAQANNIGSGALKEALASVTDEFFNAAAASTALKNLLSRGYTLDRPYRPLPGSRTPRPLAVRTATGWQTRWSAPPKASKTRIACWWIMRV